MFTMRLPEELENRLERMAKLNRRSKSYYARAALEAYLEDLEDIYAVEQRRKKSPAQKTYTIEEVEKRLGLARRNRSGSGKRPTKARPTRQ